MAKSRPVPENEEIRKSLQERFEEHRKVIVGGGILAVVLAVGVILYVVMSGKAEEHRWFEVQQAATRGSLDADRTLEEMAEKGDSAVRRNALLSLAKVRYQNHDYQGAIEAIDSLESEFGDSYLVGLPSPDTRYALVGEIRRRAQAELEWKKTNAWKNPEPDTTRVALVETSRGAFWLGFFPEYAAEHVKNFVKQAKSGAFNGTKVYETTPQAISLGGATTRDDDPANDNEVDLLNLQEPEEGRFWLQQSRGRVSSVAYAEGESKLRITIVGGASGAPNLDKKQTVFAEVLRDRGTGLDAIDSMRNVVTYGSSGDKKYDAPKFADLADHPVEPIVVERVSIWSDGRIEAGHDWDTSTVTPPKNTVGAGKAPEKTDEGTDSGSEKGAAEDGTSEGSDAGTEGMEEESGGEGE